MLGGGDNVFAPVSHPVKQAVRVVAAVASNPKPWWTGPSDSKGMFLQVLRMQY